MYNLQDCSGPKTMIRYDLIFATLHGKGQVVPGLKLRYIKYRSIELEIANIQKWGIEKNQKEKVRKNKNK